VVRVRGTVHDITERKQREQEILKLKRQYQTLAKNFPNGAVFMFDDNLRYVRVGGGELEALGVAPDEIEGSKVHDIFPEQLADELAQYYTDTLEGNSHTFTQRVAGKTYRTWTVPVQIGDTDIDYGMGMSQNITGQIQRRQELERKNERLEEFASIVSHDLRSPLSIVEGRLELAQESCESDHLTRAADALDRSQALIDDLLTLAREGETVGELEPVDLADVAEDSWQTVETGSATLEAHGTHTLRADRSRLQELVENLYRNAVEHGGDGVTVSVGAMDDGFYVADTGPGIAEADREEVFEAGYSTNEDGTGFGLRIVKQIADAHEWEITVTESEQGGARFEITGVEKGA
jgi:PAS domain S-box-containing protein